VICPLVENVIAIFKKVVKGDYSGIDLGFMVQHYIKKSCGVRTITSGRRKTHEVFKPGEVRRACVQHHVTVKRLSTSILRLQSFCKLEEPTHLLSDLKTTTLT
jgi:hypothetical protein